MDQIPIGIVVLPYHNDLRLCMNKGIYAFFTFILETIIHGRGFKLLELTYKS